jgi:hypothetical protein
MFSYFYSVYLRVGFDNVSRNVGLDPSLRKTARYSKDPEIYSQRLVCSVVLRYYYYYYYPCYHLYAGYLQLYT